MCGRFTLKAPAPELVAALGLTEFPQFSPRYNIAPTQLVFCIRVSEDHPAKRGASMLRWGLIPSWAKNTEANVPLFNARSETAAEKPAFRNAFRFQRCLIPADGFFEWKTLQKKHSKQPWYIRQPDEGVFCFAGLWETWQDPSGASIESCTVLTTQANKDIAELHKRMPVVLPASSYGTWLSNASSPGQLQDLMCPLPSGSLVRYAVSSVVNKATNDSPECIQPVEPEANATRPLNRQRRLFD